MRRPRSLVVDLSAAKVLGINLAALDALAPPPRPPGRIPGRGRLIVEFAVAARPVPWSSAIVPRRGRPFKRKPLLEWQRTVRRAARQAMRGRPPYRGPVELELTFWLRRRRGAAADGTNLQKSTEDAIQRSAIVNDRQVARHKTERILDADHDGVFVRVFSL